MARWVRRLQGHLRASCGMGSATLGVPAPVTSPWDGWTGGRKEGREERKKEGKTKPGSPCDSSGRKVSRTVSPKHPMKSKATKTKISSRNKTGVLLFLLFASLQWTRERTEPSPPCRGAGTEHESALAFSAEQMLAQQRLCKIQQRMKQVMRTTPLRLRR